MEIDEFLASPPPPPDELSVQQVVVEELATEKVAMTEEIKSLRRQNRALQTENSVLKSQIEELKGEIKHLADLIAQDRATSSSSQISLLERDSELPDRFEGETRDTVLEVIRSARSQAEQEGRLRRTQLLEGVLVANEPSGTLAARRGQLEKLFADNGNVLTGPVLAELQRLGIAHKNGDTYLLPSEIIKRTY